MMPTDDDLFNLLTGLDRQSYKAYKQIQGRYSFPGFTLLIDYVQGDPFAAPSRLRVQVPHRSKQGKAIAAFPAELYRNPIRTIALCDYLTRQFERVANELRGKRGSGKSGLIAIAAPSQQVLERTSVLVNSEQVEARFVVGLPAQGRSILGRQAGELLCDDMIDLVEQALFYRNLDGKAILRHVETVEDAHHLRQQLDSQNLVAFIPNGSILPRDSGVSDKPLKKEVVPFQSPESLEVTLERPNRGAITGMGIPKGITLIVGGGYHGKSTLLQAIALGIYNHIPGDGREALVTNDTAVKIRAEDGRRIAGVNISPFINHLPQGRSTSQFSSDNASGSTSQAASIIEALELGTQLLLVDEDTSATNFMIRDRRMQALIAKEREPITPFIDKIRQLYNDYGVSTILVMGGSGDYFDVADTVIGLFDYQPQDLTEDAKAIAQQYQTDRAAEGGQSFGQLTPRIPLAKRLDPSSEGERGDRGYRGKASRGDRYRNDREGDRSDDRGGPDRKRDDRGPKLKARDVDELQFGKETIDLSAVEQLMDLGQVRGIGSAIAYLQDRYLNGNDSLTDIIATVIRDVDDKSLDVLTSSPSGELVRFRSFELAAALNRLRSLDIQ
ncbi:MAG: ABC-ATPase domain-containing protein [Leptolyngbyaceae bacterium]|nr:ABC-ATPase domain-containing protein [Leptolyngbyaceae bacterium]